MKKEAMVPSACADAIIIDHTCTDLSEIPDEWIEKAKNLTIHYAHTSHGSQITSGVEKLETQHPDMRFIYMTGHTDGSGETGNLNMRNNQVRDYCVANDKILFDFADIESYDPDGNYFWDLNAEDDCDYNVGNWADEWCAAHPGSDLCAYCSCAHSKPLNCPCEGV